MLPTAIASTTLFRTVPFHKCMMLAGIFVKKLNSASLPTAMMAGMCSPKMSMGSSNTPPPRPVKPISVPTVKPISIFSSKNSMRLLVSSQFSVPSSRFSVNQNQVNELRTENRELGTVFLAVAVGADKALALEVQNDGLRRFLGAQLGGVNYDFGIGWRLIRIRDAGEFLDDAGASLGVQAFTVALFTHFDRGGCVNQNKPAERFNHLSHRFASRLIRSDRSADRDAAVLRDLGSNIANAADVDVAMLLGESEFARQVLAHQIAVEQSDRTSAHLEEFGDQSVGDGRFARSRKPGKENGDALFVPRRIAAAQFLHHFGIGEPRRDVAAFIEALAQFRPGDVEYLGALRYFVGRNVTVFVLQIHHHLEGNHDYTHFLLMLLKQFLGIIRTVEVLAVGILSGTGVR